MGLSTVQRAIYLLLLLQSTLPSSVLSEGKLTLADVRENVEIAKIHINISKTHEAVIRRNAPLMPGTASYGFFIAARPDAEALDLGRKSLLSNMATRLLVPECYGKYPTERCMRPVSAFDLKSTSLADACAVVSPDCSGRLHARYRSMDGSCNHRASRGKSFTAYDRLLYPAYVDSVKSPRRAASKRPLPNPRRVSNALAGFRDLRDDALTTAVLQWGLFLEQDLSRPAVSSMFHFDEYFRCCEGNGFRVQPRFTHGACSSISVSGDPFYGAKFQHCMGYVRSLSALDADCRFGPRQQMNQATSFLDGSQIYGASSRRSRELRAFAGGRLRTSALHGGRPYLPLSADPTGDCLAGDANSTCFLSGDPRVNFEPHTVAVHTLWAREHNRIARELSRENASDEQLFQEARRIVVAEMQAITYNEWAAAVLDREYLGWIGRAGYDERVNPAVLNSVAVAVFGAFKSMYPSYISLYSNDSAEDDTLELREHYYKPEIFQDASALDNVLRSMTSQAMGKPDMNFNEDLINHLYTNGKMGYDALALDIQRERDHGLPGYVKYRSYLGFNEANEFSDFGDAMSVEDYTALSKVYEHPQDVDLIVGGLLETPPGGSPMGPTLSWLLTNQLWRIRAGDRYFYAHEGQAHAFDSAQIDELNKVTFARVLCDNSDGIGAVQRNIFKAVDETNPLVDCDVIPRVNLAAWKFA